MEHERRAGYLCSAWMLLFSFAKEEFTPIVLSLSDRCIIDACWYSCRDFLVKSNMLRQRLFIGSVLSLGIGFSLLCLPLAVGIWLPDAWGSELVLASVQTKVGHKFLLAQRMSGPEYETYLVHISPDGTRKYHPIDIDDVKQWKAACALTIDESKRTISVKEQDGTHLVEWSQFYSL